MRVDEARSQAYMPAPFAWPALFVNGADVPTLKRKLEALRDPVTGREVFAEVLIAEEAYGKGRAPGSPDLILLPGPGVSVHPGRSSALFRSVTKNHHKREGMVLLYGGQVSGLPRMLGERMVEDVAATVLDAFGLPIPDAMEGRSILPVRPERQVREAVRRVLGQIAANQARKEKPAQLENAIERIYPEEPQEVRQQRIEHVMPVASPLFLLGYKDRRWGFSGRALLRRELIASLMWNVLLGRSSSLFTRLYEQGLINSRFQAHYSGALTYGFSALGGETPDPERLQAELVEGLIRQPLADEDLERQKRRELGEYVSVFQNLEELAYVYNHFVFRGMNLFDVPDLIQTVTVEDLEAFRAEHVAESQRAVSLVLPANYRQS